MKVEHAAHRVLGWMTKELGIDVNWARQTLQIKIEETSNWGEYDPYTLMITISKKQRALNEVWSTIAHEIAHHVHWLVCMKNAYRKHMWCSYIDYRERVAVWFELYFVEKTTGRFVSIYQEGHPYRVFEDEYKRDKANAVCSLQAELSIKK